MTIDALSELEDLGDGEKPWCNLVFEIVDVKHIQEGSFFARKRSIVFRNVATSPVGEIGFEARVPLNEWKAQEQEIDEGLNLTVHWAQICFRSIGNATDRLLSLYEDWFGLPASGGVAPPEIFCLAVLLGDSPSGIEDSKVHSKLFFEESQKQSVESYAELFFNFDLPSRRAWLLEKDQTYRAPLARWLAGHYRQHPERVH